jgi:catechol 2,3-dioxygenase-like lactoylglutathione lyase family enzyme
MAVASVRYIVTDVDAALAFYTTHLGFKVEMHPRIQPWRFLGRTMEPQGSHYCLASRMLCAQGPQRLAWTPSLRTGRTSDPLTGSWSDGT